MISCSVARVAREERTIKGVTIPAGAAVAANIMSLMRNEEFFPLPALFRPERSVPLQDISPKKIQKKFKR